MEKINHKKASLLYDYLDHSQLFSNPVAKEDRSYVNIPFVTGNADLDQKFIAQAKEAGFVNIKVTALLVVCVLLFITQCH